MIPVMTVSHQTFAVMLCLLLFSMRLVAGTNEWWAAKPLVRPGIPESSSESKAQVNPIDAFIKTAHAERGLSAAPEADRRTLIRRLYFDLVGLPPSPRDIKKYVDDTSPRAYERLVNSLLESPRYGERWARLWMDAVHFAETHGHDQDRIRTNAWPYRDYLIESFNEDVPYDRFIQEQIAGDNLYPQNPRAIIAMGFLASGPWDESSMRDIREDTVDRQVARYIDRDDIVTTVMQTFTSTTVQCARCHDHKFDPIPQRDYYSLQAVFAATDKANRYYDSNAEVHQRRQKLLGLQKRVEQKDKALLLSQLADRQVSDWEKRNKKPTAWRVLKPETFLSANGTSLVREADDSLLASGTTPERDTYTITAALTSRRLTALRLEVMADERLPKRGPGRQATNGNLHLSEIEVLLFEWGVERPRSIALTNATADFNQEGWTISHALDGDEKSAWGIDPREGESHQAAFELAVPLNSIPSGSKLVVSLKQLHGDGHLIGRFRLAVTEQTLPIRIVLASVEQVAKVSAAKRCEDQKIQLASHVMGQHLADELKRLPPPLLVYAGASDFPPDGGHKPAKEPREIRVLRRGEISKPQDVATAGALSCVATLTNQFALENPNAEGLRRAALARWLSDRANPLTWRSIVNRVWHHHFGRGLAETLNDFGQMGSTPSHPELLDWLAVWFRDDAAGSFKKLHRLIVTSTTYRQTATNQASLADTENRYLARMNRVRLDAEQVRDAVLLMSGRLDLRMGGPSDQQFDLKPGIHVTPKVDYAKFDLDSESAHRRSVYRFLFRTLPDPMMEALDCPAGDQLTPTRNTSTTVQQALALWNSAFTVRYAEHFAASLGMQSLELEEQVGLACEWAWGRSPAKDEARDLSDYARKHGLANLCRLLFNSNEFMFVN